jgi:hypothetical protein
MPFYIEGGYLLEFARHCTVPSLGDGVMVLIILGVGWGVLRSADWFIHPGAFAYALMLATGLLIVVLIECVAVYGFGRGVIRRACRSCRSWKSACYPCCKCWCCHQSYSGRLSGGLSGAQGDGFCEIRPRLFAETVVSLSDALPASRLHDRPVADTRLGRQCDGDRHGSAAGFDDAKSGRWRNACIEREQSVRGCIDHARRLPDEYPDQGRQVR